MGAGYSRRTLPAKLGIKSGHRVRIVGGPPDYATLLAPLPEGIWFAPEGERDLDVVQFFTVSQQQLAGEFESLAGLIKRDGALWISWPKRSSGVQTDLNENIVRDIGLEHRMVDVKVIAVDETWSALKFVYRLRDRG